MVEEAYTSSQREVSDSTMYNTLKNLCINIQMIVSGDKEGWWWTKVRSNSLDSSLAMKSQKVDSLIYIYCIELRLRSMKKTPSGAYATISTFLSDWVPNYYIKLG